ncbi:hypothetical protein VUR80DRAFT_2186 [Thermomyces stellatus]
MARPPAHPHPSYSQSDVTTTLPKAPRRTGCKNPSGQSVLATTGNYLARMHRPGARLASGHIPKTNYDVVPRRSRLHRTRWHIPATAFFRRSVLGSPVRHAESLAHGSACWAVKRDPAQLSFNGRIGGSRWLRQWDWDTPPLFRSARALSGVFLRGSACWSLGRPVGNPCFEPHASDAPPAGVLCFFF